MRVCARVMVYARMKGVCENEGVLGIEGVRDDENMKG